MEQDRPKKKKGECKCNQAPNVIDKNWKDLIRSNKLNITSSEDKSFAKVIAEPLERIWPNNWEFIKKNFIVLFRAQ